MPPKAAKAKALGKTSAKAKASRTSSPAPKAPPAPPPPPTNELPEPAEAAGLSAKEAEAILGGLRPEALIALAETTDESEQLCARLALEYVGEKDLSWDNAKKSLRTGSQFLQEMLDMQTGEFITRQSFQRFEQLGSPDISALWHCSRTAYLLAVFLQACLREARNRLGLQAAEPLPPPPSEPPAWPLVIGFKECWTSFKTFQNKLPLAELIMLNWRHQSRPNSKLSYFRSGCPGVAPAHRRRGAVEQDGATGVQWSREGG